MIHRLTYVYLTGDSDRPRLTTIRSFHKIDGLSVLLRRYAGAIEYKRCVDNATMLALRVPGVSYVEGEVWMPQLRMSVEHAWNVINGQYFDLTWELHQGLHNDFQYYAIIEGSIFQLIADGFDPNRADCLLHQLINKQRELIQSENTLCVKSLPTV